MSSEVNSEPSSENTNTHRSRHHIVADILAALAQSPLNRTRIMWSARLSYQQLCIYLQLLQNHNLIVAREDRQYEITEKGKDYLQRLKAVPELDQGDEN